MEDNHTFQLAYKCFVVNGYKRSLICDLYGERIVFIPHNFFEENESYFDLNHIAKRNNQEEYIILEFFEYLIAEKVLRKLGKFNVLNNHSYEYDESVLNNTIIEYNPDIDYSNVFRELYELNYLSIQLRAFNNTLDHLYSFVSKLSFSYIEIIAKYDDSSIELLENYYSKKVNIFNVILHSAPEDKNFIIRPNGNEISVYFVSEIISNKDCGSCNTNLFTINETFYFSSLKTNSCLANKVSIDFDGNIRNCPSMNTSYGNIANYSIRSVLESSEIKSIWSLTKDNINVCKDCEFRYICTDCRAYVEDPEDILSKPLKCGYDPFTGTWTEWKYRESSKQSIKFYGL